VSPVDVVVLAAYGSLDVELTCFPIPSEASTWQLLEHSDGAGAGALAILLSMLAFIRMDFGVRVLRVSQRKPTGHPEQMV